MARRQPTPMQRQALYVIHKDMSDPANLAEFVGVKGGYDNEAVFVQRLLDRGWVGLVVTDDGYRVMGFEWCEDCVAWEDPDEGRHL